MVTSAEARVEPRLVGGHVVLDLINTVAPRIPGASGQLEFVETPDELLHWSGRARLLTTVEVARVEAAWADSPASARQALHASIDVRESAYDILMASLGVGAAAAKGAASELERLTLRWSAATARSALVLGGPTGPAAVLSVGNPGPLLIPDRLAYAAVDLLRTVDLAQLRICPVEQGGCGWLFLDRSRNGSRRWCAMEDCGTQAKSRRLTQRRRDQRATRANASMP